MKNYGWKFIFRSTSSVDDGEVSKLILKGTKTVEVINGDGGVDDDFDDSTETTTTPSTTTETIEFDAVGISAAYVGDRKFTVSIRTNLVTEQRELLIYSGEEIFSRITFEECEKNFN